MYCTSDVISGGGISSSASFETLICTIIDSYYNENKSHAFEIAQIGRYAENVYFGKKCGLLDQTVAAFGGLASIDFKYRTESVNQFLFTEQITTHWTEPASETTFM